MVEIEAKFTIDSPVIYWRLQMIDHIGDYSLSTSQVENVRDLYLDTRRRRILAAGYSLRKREQRDGILITLKTISPAEGAVHHRGEWEILLPVYHPPSRWPESPVREKVLDIIGSKNLVSLFELRQTRILRQLSRGALHFAELSLDRVSMLINDQEQVFMELEVEIAAPHFEENLAEIINLLQHECQECNLTPDRYSKFERALTLLENQSRRSKKG